MIPGNISLFLFTLDHVRAKIQSYDPRKPGLFIYKTCRISCCLVDVSDVCINTLVVSWWRSVNVIC